MNVFPAKRCIHESGVTRDQIVSLGEKADVNRF